jgi:hypothetical protein
MTSLEDLTGIEFDNIEANENENENEKSKIHKQKAKPRISTYKYSNKGKSNLYESVLINGFPKFISCTPCYELEIVESLEEGTRILEPPHEEEYPYNPYEFQEINDLNCYLQRAKKETVDSIYQQIKSIVRQFNDVNDKTITLLSAYILGSYFQDRLSTVHYLFIVGDNGTGKSVFGDTFECLGYRVVKITNATEAFWFRIFGTIEPGQVTIVAEEVDKLEENSQIMSMLKDGYQPNAKVPRMNNDNDKMDFYYPFCFKIMIAERSPSENKARGVLDRSFKIKSYRGCPKEKIKEVRNPQGNTYRKKLLDEIIDIKKLILLYRMIHFKDPLKEVDVGLDGRDEELCKPISQLFYNLGASEEIQKEIDTTLQQFLKIKNNRKENSIEAIIYPILVSYVSQNGNVIPSTRLWELITTTLEGQLDEKNPNVCLSADYGKLYRNTTIKMVCDKFGAEKKHERTGNIIIFDLDHLAKMGKTYAKTNGIQSKLVADRDRQGTVKCDSCDSSDALLGRTLEPNSSRKGQFQTEITPEGETENAQPLLQNESPESLESPVTKDLEFPFIVTSTGTKMYRCPFHIEGCRIQNIHPEEIEYHIKYKHPQVESQRGNFSYRHNTMYNQIILLNLVIPRSKIKICS